MEARCSAGAGSGRVFAVCTETAWPGGSSMHTNTRGHCPRQRTGMVTLNCIPEDTVNYDKCIPVVLLTCSYITQKDTVKDSVKYHV